VSFKIKPIKPPVRLMQVNVMFVAPEYWDGETCTNWCDANESSIAELVRRAVEESLYSNVTVEAEVVK
jgi:hypothetical protein